MAIRICPKCGGKCSDTRKDCPHCGYVFIETKVCPECNENIDVQLDECPICGYHFINVDNKGNPNETEQDRDLTEITDEEENIEKEKLVSITCPNCRSNDCLMINDDEYACKNCNYVFTKNDLKKLKIEPQLVSITCPNCGSNDCLSTGNNEYSCKNCNSTFVYNDGKPTIINNINVNNNDKDDFKKKALSFDKTISKDEFKRSLFIALATNEKTPSDLFDTEIKIVEEKGEVYFGAFEVESQVSCSVGYDRIEEYWDKESKVDYINGKRIERLVDVKKTKTVTDWSPYHGTYSDIFSGYAFEDGQRVSEFRSVIKGVNKEKDVHIIDFPKKYSQKAYKELKHEAEFTCESLINIPGDHYKNASYNSSSKLVELFYFTGPIYRSSYTYNGEVYKNYAFAFGDALPPLISNYPNEDENILVRAHNKTIGKANASFVFKVIAIISLVIAFILLFAQIPWVWPISLLFIILEILLECKSNKEYNNIITNAKKIKTDKKKQNLIKALRDNNLKALTSDEEKKFDFENSSDSFEKINKKKFRIINYILIVIFIIVFAFSIYTTVIVINNKKEEELNVRDDNKIYFGKYPQTEVEATTENGLLLITFDSSTWTSYRYYISSSQSDFMYYKDVDIDNNGTYDYRGVYFTQYRPYTYSLSSSIDYTYQDDNGYSTNTIYWFSYDPIEWDILTESSGKALIIANLILDSQDYYPSSFLKSFSHNGGTGYANNYELSAIRKFLNDNFYNTAFNELQKALIETTTVDNSAESTEQSPNSYACDNTNDKIFLLSYKEATTYYTSETARQAIGTDYAKCQGLHVNSSNGNSSWWLRSPNSNYASNAYSFKHDGNFFNGHVCRTCYGVRPACWINL